MNRKTNISMNEAINARIASIEKKRKIERFSSLIADHEGYKPKAYPDPVRGKDTMSVGYGINLEEAYNKNLLRSYNIDPDAVRAGKVAVPKPVAREILKKTTALSMKTAERYLDDFYSHPESVQLVVTDMAYNLGENRLAGFKDFKKSIDTRNYKEAAEDIKYTDKTRTKLTPYWEQTKRRAVNLYNILKNVE
jgi:GH24 family phage-related lysozyme (muramidase)